MDDTEETWQACRDACIVHLTAMGKAANLSTESTRMHLIYAGKMEACTWQPCPRSV